MQIIRLQPGNMSEIIQIRNLSALKSIDYEVRIDDLSDVCDSLTAGVTYVQCCLSYQTLRCTVYTVSKYSGSPRYTHAKSNSTIILHGIQKNTLPGRD